VLVERLDTALSARQDTQRPDAVATLKTGNIGLYMHMHTHTTRDDSPAHVTRNVTLPGGQVLVQHTKILQQLGTAAQDSTHLLRHTTFEAL